jgi:hypothetical protein
MKPQSESERRSNTRHAIALPVEVAGLPGTTMNVNSTGVLFESPLPARVGEPIDFRLELEPHEPNALLIRCHGHVVRALPTGSGTRVAATIESIENED